MTKNFMAELKELRRNATEVKWKFVKAVNAAAKECMKMSDNVTEMNACFRKIHESMKIAAAAQRERFKEGIANMKTLKKLDHEKKFMEGLRTKTNDLTGRMTKIFSKLRDVPKKLDKNFKKAVKNGMQDAVRHQKAISQQYGKPLGIVLLVIAVVFLCAAPIFSLFLLRCVKPNKRETKYLRRSVRDQWESQVRRAKFEKRLELMRRQATWRQVSKPLQA
ncbi:hypothetical protein L596_008953 [Steinernema carpocapsae]|uniref:Uncharacterized protein n=1 Tax=Steinernema carpocapsae TaxID=34508 RepID=A0A4V6A6G1_STECR|nr:hypothetical protein L596_008953 [Steinernema carpocapsae]